MHRFILLAAGLVLVRIAHGAEPAGVRFELALVDMQGQKKVLGTLPGSVSAPRVSPDSKQVAYELVDDPPIDPKGPQILRPYVAELDKLDKAKQLQASIISPRNIWPEWSPDRDWIVFAASGNGSDAIFKQLSDGYIQPKYLVDGYAPEGVYDDGLLLFLTRKGDKDYGIALLDMNTRKILQRFDQPGSAQHSSELSRDGKWIAFTSDETGRPEIWLQSLAEPSKRVQLTKQGGARPQWAPDGSKLYYDQGGRLFSLNVALNEQAPRASAEPVPLPITGFQQGEIRRQYDLMPDGKGFVMLFPAARR
jgi:Tol biopolymer transport system component